MDLIPLYDIVVQFEFVVAQILEEYIFLICEVGEEVLVIFG